MKTSEVAIQTPCGLDWRKMTPQAGGRFCGECKKVVRDLSSMTEGEASALLRGPERGNLCVRYVYDAHGRVIFDARVSREFVPAAMLARAKRAAAVVATAALPLAVEACSSLESVSNEASARQEQRYDDPNDPNYPYGESMGGAPVDPDDIPPADAGDASDASADGAAETPDAAAEPDSGVVIPN